jgi:hypothetical protein
MKMYGVVEGKLHVFITSAPGGGMISFMLQVLLYLCPRVSKSLDGVLKRKSCTSCRN